MQKLPTTRASDTRNHATVDISEHDEPQRAFEYYASPLGTIKISADNDQIVGLDFVDDASGPATKHPVLTECRRQLDEYFAGQRNTFDIAIHQDGTDFQGQVWRELMRIPYGRTVSYQHIAKNIDRPKAVRAVGLANGQNKIAIIVPCHRVIGSDGSLTGYASGIWRKKALLQLEQGAVETQLDLG